MTWLWHIARLEKMRNARTHARTHTCIYSKKHFYGHNPGQCYVQNCKVCDLRFSWHRRLHTTTLHSVISQTTTWISKNLFEKDVYSGLESKFPFLSTSEQGDFSDGIPATYATLRLKSRPRGCKHSMLRFPPHKIWIMCPSGWAPVIPFPTFALPLVSNNNTRGTM
jgi:hypothetical protein